MSATVLEKQDRRLYADDTMPLCPTIVQYRSVGSHVVRRATSSFLLLLYPLSLSPATGVRDTRAQITQS